MSSRARKRPLYHPLNWPAWLGIRLFRLLCMLPWKAQLALGAALGRFAFLFLPGRRKIVDVNLSLCFPELSGKERRALASRHYAAVGIGLFETGMAWWPHESRLPPFNIIGKEHLEAAKAQGKGVILFTAHFTTLEICGRIFSRNFSMGGLYRNPDNPVVAREMHRGRIDKMSAAVPMDDLRGLIRALRNGHIMWYAPDQGKKGKLFQIVPFFGVPAQTNTATSRIARMSGSPVVPYFGMRRPDGSYELRILPPLENFPTEDPEADSLLTNRLIEDFVREAPEQYFWVHRRFKKRGEGYENVYL
jgi:Kdo2-lipid IVA lauroyltransferase/acyltransferase